MHHARKGAGAVRGGQALRGSSELHAWGDSNLYLRRVDERLLLSIEHRAAPSQSGLALALRGADGAVALHLVDTTAPRPGAPPSPIDRLTDILAHSDRPLTLSELRLAGRLRTASVCQALAALTTQGRVRKTPEGYQLTVSRDPLPALSLHPTGNGNG